MTINRKLFKRIILLSAILLISELIYLSLRKGYITIDSIFTRIFELFLTLIISLLIITIIRRFTEKKVWTMFEKEMDLEQRIIIARLYSIGLYSIAFFITFWRAGVSLGNLTIFLGLIATGFAFAIRDLLLSFFGWFIILNRKPFKMGEFISIENNFGLVTRIGTFFFTLEINARKDFVKVPNSLILSKPILNKGVTSYREEIKIPLKSIPIEHIDLLRELQTYVKSRTHFQEPVKAHLIAEHDGWFIIISYQTNLELETLKPAIFSECLRLFNEHLKIS